MGIRHLLLVVIGVIALVTTWLALTPPPSPPSSPVSSSSTSLDVSAFHRQFFLEYVQRNPEWNTELRLFSKGKDPTGDQLTDVSAAAQQENIAFIQGSLAKLRSYDRLSQTHEQLVATDILDWYLDDVVRSEPFLFHDYPVNQMFGVQNQIISFLTDIHLIRNQQEAGDYVKRLSKIGEKFDQVLEGLRLREKRGIIPPRVIVDQVLAWMRDFVARDVLQNPLYTSFLSKLNTLNPPLFEANKKALEMAAELELRNTVYPAYQELIVYVEQLRALASETEVGVWRLPDGDAYYAYLLRHHTTTDLTPEEVHQLGLREVERLQQELSSIVDDLGIAERATFGDRVRDYFNFTRQDSRFFYPNSAEGRAQALTDYHAIIAEVEQKVASLFDVLPQARVRVEAVPDYLQAGAPGAFYQPPSLDGSRLGTFFVNLANLPFKPGMQTLAYHEAVPGHHFQLALQGELDLPLFQKALIFNAHAEGWALYAEKLAREQGFYDDIYSQIENLRSELFRAARLVVDTGIHYKRWTREQAMAYMNDNIGGPAQREIDRYIVLPGQACSYKIGELKILEWRAKAKNALRDRFDIKAFHNVILKNGGMPLTLLEQEVNRYIEEAQAA